MNHIWMESRIQIFRILNGFCLYNSMIKRVVSRCWIWENVSSLKGKFQGNYACIEVFVTRMFSANFNHKTHGEENWSLSYKDIPRMLATTYWQVSRWTLVCNSLPIYILLVQKSDDHRAAKGGDTSEKIKCWIISLSCIEICVHGHLKFLLSSSIQ